MSTVAVILAAGLGTRMKSRLPKVLHPILGDPTLLWVLRALPTGLGGAVVVIHHGKQQVLAALVQGHRRKFPLQEFLGLPGPVRDCARRLCVLLRLAVLIDTSNSIRERFKFEQEAAIQFINSVVRPLAQNG